jgi:hypothetical protein
VAARTRPLSDFGLFRDDAGEGRFGELLAGGMVLDVHTLMEKVQLAAAAFVLRKVYQEMFHWEQTNELRLAVVLDEALLSLERVWAAAGDGHTIFCSDPRELARCVDAQVVALGADSTT